MDVIDMKAKKTNFVAQLKAKYKKELAQARKGRYEDGLELRAVCETDLWLFQKWAYRVARGWYGFDLGNVPNVWRLILDEFLEWVQKQQPEFKILQVKVKFGRLRMYLGTKDASLMPDEHIRAEVAKLEALLSLTPVG